MDLADDELHHDTRDDFLHYSDLEWSAAQRRSETIGNPDVGAMLLSLSRDEQHATIAKFIQHELDESIKKITLLEQQGSQQLELLREQGDQHADMLMQQSAQQAEMLRQQQAGDAAAGSTHSRRSKSWKIDISKYKAVESD